MSIEEYSDELQEEKEVVDSIFNFIHTRAKWEFSEEYASVTIDVQVEEHEGECGDAYVIRFVFDREYPSTLPTVVEFKMLVNHTGFSSSEVAQIEANARSIIQEWKGQCLVMETIEFCTTQIEKLQKRKLFIEKQNRVEHAKQQRRREKLVRESRFKQLNNFQDGGERQGKKKHIIYVDREEFNPTEVKKTKNLEPLKHVDMKMFYKITNKMEFLKLADNCVKVTYVSCDVTDFQTRFHRDVIPANSNVKFKNKRYRMKALYKNTFTQMGGRFKTKRMKREVRLGEITTRVDYAMATIGKYHFLHGGFNGKHDLGDFLRIRYSENNDNGTGDIHVEKFENLHEYNEMTHQTPRAAIHRPNYLTIPKMSRHMMLAFGGGLFIIGTENAGYRGLHFSKTNNHHSDEAVSCFFILMKQMFFFISCPTSQNGIFYGRELPSGGKYKIRHPVRGNQNGMNGNNDFFPNTREFSACSFGQHIWIFGGQLFHGGSMTDNLYSVEFSNFINVKVKCFKNDTESSITWPCPRRGHSCVAYQSSMFVLGGISENDTYLNDLYSLDVTTGTWREIDINYYTPMESFSSYLIPNGFVLIGGKTRKGVSDLIYSYSYNEEKFFMTSYVNPREENENMKEMSLLHAKSNFFGGCVEGNALILGGKDHQKFTKVVKNAMDVGKRYELCNWLERCKKEKLFTDVVLTALNELGDSVGEIQFHLCVASARSARFGKFIRKFNFEDGRRIVDMTKQKRLKWNITVWNALVHFLYTGELDIEGEKNINDLGSAFQEFRIQNVRNHLRRNKSSFTSQVTIFKEIQNNFCLMLKESLLTDVTLIFNDGSKLECHKVVIVRSKHFERILTSNFKESYTNEIELFDFDKTAVSIIIEYLYTDRINVDNATAIGVLLYSLQFELKEISNFCHKFVAGLLTNEIVLQILALADTYLDKILQSICIRYVVANYEEVSLMDGFDQMEQETKNKIITKTKLRKKS